MIYLKHDEPQLPNIGDPDPAQLVLTLREAPSLEGFPYAIRSQVSVCRDDHGTYSVSITGKLPPDAEAKIVEAAAPAEQGAVRKSLAARREIVLEPLTIRPKTSILQVPQLCLLIDGELEPAQEEHFLPPDSWNLLDYPAELTEAEFMVEERTDTYEIDIKGLRLVERHLATQSIFAFDEVPTNWTDLQLSRELVDSIRKDLAGARHYRRELLREFIRLILCYLKDRRGISLNTLYRVRAPLERALRDKIEQYRQKAYAAGFQMCLFSPEAAVETSSQYAFSFDPENYPATLHYNGGFQFPKHYYQGMVGEFDSKEELECAKAIEMCPRITRWVRNVRGMFSLPTSSGKFYPDFVAELDDGRFLVVEYKGEHLIQYDQEKKNVGELWESKSAGKAVFLWAIKKDSAGRDVPRQLAAKLGSSH